jgi:hypothetical protein
LSLLKEMAKLWAPKKKTLPMQSSLTPKDYTLIIPCLSFNSHWAKKSWIQHFQWINAHVIWCLKKKSHVGQ